MDTEKVVISLLTLNNFSDVKLHVQVWIFTIITKLKSCNDDEDLRQRSKNFFSHFLFYILLNFLTFPSEMKCQTSC